MVYIDKQGGVDLIDCETVSLAIEPLIDEADPIEHAYVFCVSSPGIDRPLKKPRDYERAVGTKVDVKLYEKLDGKKSSLLFLFHTMMLSCGCNRQRGRSWNFAREKIALIRPHIDF